MAEMVAVVVVATMVGMVVVVEVAIDGDVV